MTVLLGGVRADLLTQEAMRHADSVLTGLGEDSFPQALRDFAAGRLAPLYRQSCETTVENRPLPRKDLLNRKRYITLNTVEAIRGCCHTCTFCAHPQAFGKKLYKGTISDNIGEITTRKGKVGLFPDVNLIADRDFAMGLFAARVPLRKWWMGLTTTVINEDAELLAMMKKSGCKGLLIGFESVNQATQQDIRKGNLNQVDEYKNLMKLLHKNGIMVMGCFAFGSDEDGPDVFRRTVQMCEEAKIDLPRFSVITPFPETEYYRQLEAEGRIVERDWALYDVEHVVYKPLQMTAPQLVEGMEDTWRAAYSWRSIFKRIDWKNFHHLWMMYPVYFLANIGYRQYAKKFAAFDENVMRDNSDIPLPQKEAALP